MNSLSWKVKENLSFQDYKANENNKVLKSHISGYISKKTSFKLKLKILTLEPGYVGTSWNLSMEWQSFCRLHTKDWNMARGPALGPARARNWHVSNGLGGINSLMSSSTPMSAEGSRSCSRLVTGWRKLKEFSYDFLVNCKSSWHFRSANFG